MKARIVERTHPDGDRLYVIQQRLFGIWLDAFFASWSRPGCPITFRRLDEARRNLCYFDGSRPVDRAVTDTEE